jgi:hypothetical protein
MLYVAASLSLLIIGGMLGVEYGADVCKRRLSREYEQLAMAWRELDVEKSHLEKMNRMLRVTTQVGTDIRRLRRFSIAELERRS